MAALSPLELAILQAACAHHPEHAAVLTAQIAAITVNDRRNTGSGWYADIDVDADAAPALVPAKFLADILVTIVGGITLHCLVFARGGYLAMIECFAPQGGVTSAIDYLTAPFTPPAPETERGTTRH